MPSFSSWKKYQPPNSVQLNHGRFCRALENRDALDNCVLICRTGKKKVKGMRKNKVAFGRIRFKKKTSGKRRAEKRNRRPIECNARLFLIPLSACPSRWNIRP